MAATTQKNHEYYHLPSKTVHSLIKSNNIVRKNLNDQLFCRYKIFLSTEVAEAVPVSTIACLSSIANVSK